MSLRRGLLPVPKHFYEQQIGQLTRPNRKGWALGNCPFHDSRSRRSFGINLNSGAFCCFGCRRKGDLASFVMQLKGVDFKAACQFLGCWEERKQKLRIPSRSGSVVRYLVFNFEIDGIRHRAEIDDEPHSELQSLRRLAAEATDRLREIRNGDAERFQAEEESQWAILVYAWELIQMEVSTDVR
jgi:hypothetical protein